MKVILISVLLMFPALGSKASGFPLEIMTSSDIQDIERLDAEVDKLTAKIRQCAAAGLAPALECHCFYPDKLAAATVEYRSLLDKHPDWENRAVLWWAPSETSPSNLHLGGLKLTIETPCQNLVGR